MEPELVWIEEGRALVAGNEFTREVERRFEERSRALAAARESLAQDVAREVAVK